VLDLKNVSIDVWDKTIWGTLHFLCDFRHSNQIFDASKCSNVLLIFFDFCSSRVLSKTEENTEKYFLIKEICKEQKIWRTLQKKAVKSRHARTHAKFSSSRARRKKICIDESSGNL
jgi:hypothetical protein